MKTLRSRSGHLAFGATLLLLPIGLIAGCGGGGGGGVTNPSNPTATPTATGTATGTATPTATTVTSNAIGTYEGTYTFPPSGLITNTRTGSFILRVQTDGSATGTFDEDDPDNKIVTSGTVNLSSGRISLSGNYLDDLTFPPANVTITVSGTATSAGAGGNINVTEGSSSMSGTFAANKTSTTIKPTPTPSASALKKHGSTTPWWHLHS